MTKTNEQLESAVKRLVSILDNQGEILNSHQMTMELISQGSIAIGERINSLEERIRELEGPATPKPKPKKNGKEEDEYR